MPFSFPCRLPRHGIAFLCLISAVSAAEVESKLVTPNDIGILMEDTCYGCHDDATQKGDVRLDTLGLLPLDARLDLLNRMQEKVYTGEMPPKKKKSQPTEDERSQILAWMSGELGKHDASKLEEKLRMPGYGNYVNHEKLFSGQYKNLKAFTPDRRWLISEYIFDAKFNKLLEHTPFLTIDGTRHFVIGSNNRPLTLTNPFLLPTDSGVRYYDTTLLDGGHLLTMITNAKAVADSMISLAAKKNYVPAIQSIMAQEWADGKILASRELYLKANIGSLLAELYGSGNAAMLPHFSPSKAVPTQQAVGSDGKPLKKPVFDTAAPSRDEVAEIWAGIERYSKDSATDDILIAKCERDWFISGVNQRTLDARVTFMRGYMDDLRQRLTQYNPANPTAPPAEPELAIIREAIKQHRKKGDTYSAVIAKCMAAWDSQFKQERAKSGTIGDAATGDLVDQLFLKILERAPTAKEKTEYSDVTQSDFAKLGNEKAIG